MTFFYCVIKGNNEPWCVLSVNQAVHVLLLLRCQALQLHIWFFICCSSIHPVSLNLVHTVTKYISKVPKLRGEVETFLVHNFQLKFDTDLTPACGECDTWEKKTMEVREKKKQPVLTLRAII